MFYGSAYNSKLGMITHWHLVEQFLIAYFCNMAKLKLDLHDIYNKGYMIEQALEDIIYEAMEKKIKEVEIIPGKGSGQLKKKVLRFLQRPDIKCRYHRLVKDQKNFGRLFVRFK